MTQVDGTIAISGDIALIGFERRLHHPIEAVWAALTEPGQISTWLGEGTLEPRQGGSVALRTGPEGRPDLQRSMSGRVLSCEPPRLLEYEWLQPGLDLSVVRYELEAEAGGTVLRFTHRRSISRGALGGRAGWHAYLDRLAAHLDGLPVPSWAERRAAVEQAYEEAPIQG